MRIELSDDGRDFQRRDWTDLVHADPSGTFFHQPAYLKLYWEEFGARPEQLLLAFAYDDQDGMLAASAFERTHDGVLRFLGGTEVTDYLGPVGRPEVGEEVATELWSVLTGLDGWSTADLRGLPEDSPWLGHLRAAAIARGLTVEGSDDPNGPAPRLGLAPTWEGYLEGLPSKLRHEIKRKAKKLQAETGGFRIVTAGPGDVLPLLDRFVDLHRMSDGPKGVFMVPGIEIFFRRLGERFCEENMFRLTFIEVGDELAAGTIGFVFDDTYLLYNSAFDRRWGGLAPGMVLVGEDIRLAIEEGCAVFDLLKGDYAYKYRFGAHARPVRRLLVTR